MGTLYLVATPIGNLEDITLRALRTLREASLIAAEDTRVARKLLDHYDITTPVKSFHDDAPDSRATEIIAALANGDVAFISDAGMPGISDPGSRLIELAIQSGYPVQPIPGSSSVTSAAAISGMADHGYVFGGFLPRKEGERTDRLRDLTRTGLPVVLFEAPSRVRSLLELVGDLFPRASVVAGREITKLHEEWLRGSPAEVLDRLNERGEFTLVILPNHDPDAEPRADLDNLLTAALDSGATLRDAVDQTIAATGLPRRVVYERALEIRESGSGGL